ncbi:MAG: GlsB/YeaQ/YmgE family stress response membrane protein [Iphinoe sp. HA4291-MV1]|jgi:uncharacterized membrane protein YeaQ/YmgE (transglycosylase-associated protein family)|nr:GlsB/YeaQ/YmgE family stress response membrane protein [Iphinoe sp. HA4291-MV1]
MDIIAWVVLGLLAGAIAKAIYPGYQGGGILATILLGIVGAFIGGTLGVFLQTGKLALAASGFSLYGLALAVVGALIAIFIWYSFARRTV